MNDLNAIQACRRLGITLDALYRLIYADRIPARKENGKWRIDSAGIKARLKAKQERNRK